MNLRNLCKRLWHRVTRAQPTTNDSPPAAMQAMLEQLARTQPQELSCDEVYEVLDSFAERAHRGEDAAALMPLVQHHLELCPDCREELAALLRSLEATE